MDRIRIGVLAALAAATVVTFALAPDDGRFARVPLMVMLAVLALIWHLAKVRAVGEPPEQVRAGPAPVPATGVSTSPPPTRRPGFFELASAPPPPSVPDAADREHHLGIGLESDLEPAVAEVLPPPPAAWPLPAVQVPLAFQNTVIDLTDDGPILAPIGTDAPIGAEEPADPEEPADRPLGASLDAGGTDDPWLAFAAKMFGGD